MVTPQTRYGPHCSNATQKIRRKEETKVERDTKYRKKAQPGVTKQATSQHTSPSGAPPMCRHLATCFMEAWEADMYIIPITQTRILRLRQVK